MVQSFDSNSQALPSSKWPRGHWYPLMTSAEIKAQRLYSFTRLDLKLVAWRNLHGEVCVLENRCPHRSAELSLGRWSEGNIECGYHGMQFDGSGTCQQIPLNGWQGPRCATLKAQSFVVQEIFGVIWLWWGEAAEQKKLPWFESLKDENSERNRVRDYVEIQRSSDCNFFRFMEANLDFGHFHFVHSFFKKTDELGSLAKNFSAKTTDLLIQLKGELGREGSPRFSKVWADVLFPNLAAYETPHADPEKRLPLVVLASPVDAKTTWFVVRIYLTRSWLNPIIKIYLKYFFFGVIFKLLHRQDLRLLRTQSATNHGLPRQEHLVCEADVGVAHYHRLLRRSLASASEKAPATTARLVAKEHDWV